jgi:hypothetical protein
MKALEQPVHLVDGLPMPIADKGYVRLSLEEELARQKCVCEKTCTTCALQRLSISC